MSCCKNLRAFFLTLGCAKNEADSESMSSALMSAKYLIVDDIENADIVFVNTCSFIQSATEESIDAIFAILECEYIKSNKIPVVVCGCMTSRYGEDLAEELTEAAAFLSCKDEDAIVDLSDRLLGITRDGEGNILSAKFRNIDFTYYDDLNNELNSLDVTKSHNTQKTFAYVKISDGCSRFCSYCTIPYIRGSYHSFEYSDIYKQVEMYIRQGVKEIVLIGQDTGLWGIDFSKEDTLASLLERLSNEFPNTWFKFMYTQPENVSDELIDVVSKQKNICSYFDIPMQHCSSDILSAMNRKGSTSSLLGLIQKIRNKIENVAIRTTLMVGFPGESDKEFEELLNFVSDARFDYVGVFAYSAEDGTAASKLALQIDEDEKSYRAEQLRTLADYVSFSVISQRIGSNTSLLVEGFEEDGQLIGRTMSQAPEVDGITFIDKGLVGDIVEVTIDDTLMYDMEATINV